MEMPQELAEMFSGGREDLDQTYPELDPDMRKAWADKLREAAANFQPLDCKVGDIVEWKLHMQDAKSGHNGHPMVILEVLDEPIRGCDFGVENAGHTNHQAAALIDVVIGHFDPRGIMIHFFMDSRRLQHADL